jgi:hypothetical protein
MNTQTVLTDSQRVANGLAWMREHSAALDLHTSRIDLDGIELYQPYTCVLAQAGARGYGDIVRDAIGAGIVDEYYHEAMIWSWTHAFYPTPEEDTNAVAQEWRRVLSTSEPF